MEREKAALLEHRKELGLPDPVITEKIGTPSKSKLDQVLEKLEVESCNYIWWNDEDQLTFNVSEVLGVTAFDPADLQKMVITKSCLYIFSVKNPKQLEENQNLDLD